MAIGRFMLKHPFITFLIIDDICKTIRLVSDKAEHITDVAHTIATEGPELAAKAYADIKNTYEEHKDNNETVSQFEGA